MNPNPYDHLFREVAETRREVKRPIDMRECDSCKTVAAGLQPFDGRRLCEPCRMHEVNLAMTRAARGPVCDFCPTTSGPACRSDNDRAACRTYQTQSLLKEPAHV